MKSKSFKFLRVMPALALIILLLACASPYNGSASDGNQSDGNQAESGAQNTAHLTYQRGVDYNGINYTPWDVDTASKNVTKRDKKPYTIMIYLNGSDLESDYGAATNDLIEMLDSGVSSRYLNLIVFTGGTNRWRNSTVPSNQCALWEIADGRIKKIASAGLRNMGNPGTLSSFISFCTANYPAEKTGLIFWDHGGGSIAGFGHDEKFNDGSLTLLKMNYAFEAAGLADNKLEFIGFDSCLMATAEMAVVASPFFNYLIASEDLEPGDGWDYYFLWELNRNPYMNGAELGRCVADYYMDYYGTNAEADLTMSVTDLSKAFDVMNNMGELMSLCSEDLLSYKSVSFSTLSNKRNQTKTFGGGSPRDNESDMVDVGDMALNLADIFPEQAGNLLLSLNDAVVYNVHNSGKNLYGLSSYYVYGGKRTGSTSLSVYSGLKMDEGYTAYLNNFFGFLKNNSYLKQSGNTNSSNGSRGLLKTSGFAANQAFSLWSPLGGDSDTLIMTGIRYGVSSDTKNMLWPRINSHNVCLYKISESSDRSMYAVPVSINGRDADIIVLFNESNIKGKILGLRYNDGFIIQKGYTPIESGDKISFYYKQRGKNSSSFLDNWHKSSEFTVEDGLSLTWSKSDSGTFALIESDLSLNEHITDVKTAAKQSAAA